MPSHPVFWRSILISFSHLCLGRPSGLFPSDFPTKTLFTPLTLPHTCYMPAHLILLDMVIRKILGEEYRSSSPSLCSYLHSPVTLSIFAPNRDKALCVWNKLHIITVYVTQCVVLTAFIVFCYMFRSWGFVREIFNITCDSAANQRFCSTSPE